MPAAAARAAEPFDELMLRRAQRGEEPAWRALIERYHAPVHAVIWRLLAGRASHRAEDLVQDTFLRVLRALPAFDPSGQAALATWILTIATRLALNELRRPEHAALVDEPAGARGDRADASAERHRLAHAIQSSVGMSVAQLRGAATWRVGSADNVVIDAGATGASVEASGASLRVEVHMQLSSSDARVVGASVATAAVVSLVTVIVYQGYVKASSGGQTVNVAAGRTVEFKPGERPREVLDVAAAPAERGRTVGADGAFFPPMIEVVLRGVSDEIDMCLAGQALQLTAKGWARPDGMVEQISVDPPGPVASCVAGVIRNAHFPPTPAGASFSRDFTGDPSAVPARNVSPQTLDGLRIKGDKNIYPDEVDKLALQSASRAPGETASVVRVISSIKMCVDRAGKVSHVRMLKSSGYPGYDHKIQTEVMGWEYRPYEIDGKAIPVCTAVTFIYEQK